MSVEDLLHAPLRLPFGAGYDVPPPKARAAMRVQKVMAAISREESTGVKIDVDALARRMGVTSDGEYDMNVDLFGEELYEQLLDDLNVEELGIATQAMFMWIMPNGSRALAEAFIADPTPRPPANRAQRRKAKKAKKPSTST